MKKNNKGFTLIELMVVVGIIGIITGIAVPSFQRFTARAKQANARTELSAIYGMERAFFTEFGAYHSNLTVIGYAPDGVPLTVEGCLDDGVVGQWPVRYYRTGFAGVPQTVVPGLGAAVANLPCNASPFFSEVPAKAAATDVALNNGVGAIVGTSIPDGAVPATFVAGASGRIGGQRDDRWTINQNKQLVNTQIGY